ncbi:sigma-70 family RNA polymerase sigma factor [Streptomyces sp. NPDC012510]|uniref:sigma-70 family RNA polymerase sigma factor n=1 Tax=Streptomyces sp. NPDC012510 TaxID=3364838 RepID=UPI0036EB5B0A
MKRDVPKRRADAAPMTELPLDFEAFHRMHRPAYVGWAKTYLNNKADAEEAVDCAFEQLLIAWPEVLTKESPAAYAWQVMKNRTIDAARARGRREALIDSAAFETTALREAVNPIGQLEESINLFQAIEALPERQRDVVVLLYSHGHSAREAAEHLGITPAAVRSTARHARRRLQEILGLAKEGQDDDVAH